MTHQLHRSDLRVLNQRTLSRDHRRLSELLRPGQSVLDVGCGTGAITAGIARAVAPDGYAVGVDRDAGLLEIAERQRAGIPNLRFEYAEASTLPFRGEFDVVTAARTLQWIDDPGCAIARMRDAAKRGGVLVVLDYNHAANEWQPLPPPAFRRFCDAFLRWREAHEWDNQIADHLPGLLADAGLSHIESRAEDEVTVRGAPDFEDRTALWPQVIEGLGPEIVRSGFLTGIDLEDALDDYRSWAKADLEVQTLRLRAVTGTIA